MSDAQTIDRLIIALGLDPEDVSKALDKVDNEIQGTFGKMPDTVNNALAKVDAGFNNVFGGIMRNFIAPLASALAVRSMFGNYLKGADALGKTADRLGVNGEELHAWSEAAARAGGSAESFQGSIQQLSRGIEEYKSLGGGRSQKVLEAMGFTKSDFDAASGGTADVFDVLSKLSEKAETMDKMQFNAFASKLGLDQGTISLLQQGSEGLAEAIKRQKELGTYQQRDIEVTERFNATIHDLKRSFQAASAIILRMVVPVLTRIAETMKKTIQFMQQHEPFVIAFFTGLAIVLTAKLLPAVKKVGIGFMSWVKNNPVLAALSLIILGIALIIDDLITYANGGKSALEGLWKKFGTADEIKTKIENLQTSFMAFLEDTLPRLMRLAAVLTTGYAAIVLYKGAVAIFKGVTAAIKLMNLAIMANPIGAILTVVVLAIGLMIIYWDDLAEAVGGVVDWIKAAWDGFFGWINDMWDSAVSVVNTVVDSIKAAWAAFFGWIGDKIEWVSDKWSKVKGFFGGGKGETGSPAQGVSSVLTPSMSGMAEASVKPSAVTNNSKVQNSSETHIGQITVNTQATDAEGVANGVGNALQERQNNAQMVNLANSGVSAK